MLYIVATPIGNMMDLSARAIDVLAKADFIVAEDPKRSLRLLNHYAITTKMISLHEHNELKKVSNLIDLLQQNKDLALISDAGTPLISDPGYHLVRAAHQAKIKVSPVPGSSAVMAAISASGLATDRFTFIGFLPHKLSAKQQLLKHLSRESSTMIFFESPNRLISTLQAMRAIFGNNREMTFCRELTKQFETIINADLASIYDFVDKDRNNQTKGEIVLVVAGAPPLPVHIDQSMHNMLSILVEELPLTTATKLLAKMTGINKQDLYDYWVKVGH